MNTTERLPGSFSVGVWISMLLLQLAVAGFATQFLHASRQEQLAQAAAETRKLTLLLDREIAAVFGSIDTSLKILADGHAKTQVASWSLELDRHRSHLGMLSDLRAFGADGRRLADRRPDTKGKASTTDRPHFIFHRQQTADDRLLVSQPTPGTLEPQLILSRGIKDGKGRFAGIVEAVLPLKDITQSLAALSPGAEGMLGVYAGDRRPLLRHPALSANSGASGDSITRIRSEHHNLEYDLFIEVGIAEDEYLASWRAMRNRIGSLVAVFMLVTVGLALRLQRSSRQQALAQAETARSAASFNDLIDNAPYGIAIIDPDAIIRYFNPAFTRLLGYTREDVPDVATWWQKAYPDPDYRQMVMAAWQESVMAPGATGVIDKEFSVCARDGRARIIRFQVTKLDGGRILVAFDDVTAPRQAAQALARSQKLYQDLVERTPDLITRVDLAGRFLYVNHAAEKIFGLSAEDCMGRLAFDFVHPDDRSETLAAFAAWRESQQPSHEFFNRQIGVSGQMHSMSWSIRPEIDDNGVMVGFAGTARDITEIKQAEAALRDVKDRLEEIVEQRTQDLASAREAAEASERFMHLVTDAVPGQIAYVNTDYHYEFANKAYREWFGKTAEEMQGIHLRDMLGDELFQNSRPFLDQALRGERLSFLRTTADRAGNPVYLWANYVPDVHNGNVRGIIGLFSDITELKSAQLQLEHLNAQLKQQTAQAEAANRAKSDFLSNMSHEIRTPMNGIIGMANILRREGVTPQQARRLDVIDASAQHLLAVINDVLDLSKIEAQMLVLEDAPVAVGSLLTNVSSILADRARAKGILFLTEAGDLPYPLVGDPTRLQQALLNYAANAVKFTEAGSVSLRASVDSETGDTVTLRFEVRDSGIGVSEDAVPRLFTAFEQADNSMNRKYGGTGLGLAITKRLAELMGGTVGFESQVGAGSCFWFTAVLKKGQPAATPGANPTDVEAELRQRHHGRRILVVDDEPVNREVALIHLETVDLVVDTAEDGAEAIAKASGRQYDAILMDMQMPKINGVQATREIRRLDSYRNTPIIAMTANAFADSKEQCLQAGMSGVLIKPFVPDELYASLLLWLDRNPA